MFLIDYCMMYFSSTGYNSIIGEVKERIELRTNEEDNIQIPININTCYVISIINNIYLFPFYFVLRIHLFVFVAFASFVLFCFVVVCVFFFCFVITSFYLYTYQPHTIIGSILSYPPHDGTLITDVPINVEAEIQLWGTTY